MTSPRVPFFSPCAVATHAPPSTRTFGSTWQDVVTRVEAFGIEATTDKIVEIDNYPHDETRESLVEYYQNLTTHLFILLHGEYVIKVDVFHTEDVVTALRLHTTKRVTPWYGACKGDRVTFEADDGFCINALRGKGSANGCSELGVVYAPKDIAHEGHSVVIPQHVQLKGQVVDGGNHPWRIMYRSFDLAPRAIVVKTTETAVEGIRVVTPLEYDRMVQFAGSLEPTGDEQWLVLVEGERIQAVGFDIEGKRIRAVRFRTNLQVSHIFGTANKGTVTWISTREHLDMYIGGFAFEANNCAGEKPITTVTALCLLPQNVVTREVETRTLPEATHTVDLTQPE